MSRGNKLEEYRKKRNLSRSGEPSGGRHRAGGDRFVIQRHDASTLHFDFRLEVEGVLVSWAVPKGPSTDPGDKRLAIRTEDHPLDYAEFEGRIAEGEYGAGTVVVWDEGTFRNRTRKKGKTVPMEQAVEDGHLVVDLDGHKLTGAFALTRTNDAQWLLVKKNDEGADRRHHPARTQLESVRSGRTNEDFES